jgi:hypothetical protein
LSFEKSVFNKHDVIKLIADKQLDMSNLPTRRLSPTQVVIEVQNKAGVDVLSAPPNYKNSKLADLLLHSFILPDYAIKIGISEKRCRNDSIIHYFSFLERNFESSASTGVVFTLENAEVPPESIFAWRDYLGKTTSEIAAWSCLNALQKVLMRTLNRIYGKISNWPEQVRAVCVALKAITPAKPAHEKMQEKSSVAAC